MFLFPLSFYLLTAQCLIVFALLKENGLNWHSHLGTPALAVLLLPPVKWVRGRMRRERSCW